LNDSCADLAAWIVEKFRAWGDCGKYRISIFHETNFKRWRGSGKWATQGEINYAAKFSGGRFENSAPQSGEFNQRRLLIIKLVESLAVDGVFREPVSRITSLLTGKNTGKTANSGSESDQRSRYGADSRPFLDHVVNSRSTPNRELSLEY
jgi:hypothetical protein